MSKFFQILGGMYRIETDSVVNCETWLGGISSIVWKFSGGTWALVTSASQKYPKLLINNGPYTLQDSLVNGRPWWSDGSNHVYYSVTRQKYVCNVSNDARTASIQILGYEPAETADTVNAGSYIGDGWNEFDLPYSLLNAGTIPAAITAVHKGTVSSDATITFSWDIYLSSSRFGEYENADGDTVTFGTPIRDEEGEITGYV